MATEKKMDVVILGLLSHEPLHGYEIKKRINGALHYFWSGSYGSIYPTLKLLEEQSFVKKEEQFETGRKKYLYTITPTGIQKLQDWLAQPVEKDELRYETLLKLFFGQSIGPMITRQRIEEFAEKIDAELPYLYQSKTVLEEHLHVDEAHRYYLLTVMFGIQVYEAYLSWVKQATSLLDEAGASQ